MVSILFNGKRILRVNNLIFERLHDSITNMIYNENIKIPDDLRYFLYKTDQFIFGGGVVTGDIASLKTKSDALFFSILT